MCDLLEGAAILFSGSNFTKLELFARFRHMPFINEATYYRYQSNYLVPVVQKAWEDIRGRNIDRCKDRPVILLGNALYVQKFERLII